MVSAGQPSYTLDSRARRNGGGRRAGGVLVLLLLLGLIVDGAPAFAEGSPPAPGKDDSKVGPLLRGLLRESSASTQPRAAQQQREAPDYAVTRGLDADAPPSEPQRDLIRFDDAGNVQVYIYMESTDEEALAELQELGARIEIVHAGIVQAWVPPAALEAFAALDIVRDISPPDYGVTRTGSVTTEGDTIHRSNLVRELSSLTGAGVRVGVISNGVDSITSARATGHLPATVDVNPDRPGRGDEGTALLEIIHDLAPGASLAFSRAGSSLGFVRAVEWLEDDAFGGQGADIIVDDLGYYAEPRFEDGRVALAAADAVAGGVVFVSAGGNYARSHHEADFVDGGGRLPRVRPQRYGAGGGNRLWSQRIPAMERPVQRSRDRLRPLRLPARSDAHQVQHSELPMPSKHSRAGRR